MIIQQRLDALKELAILDTPSDSTFENLTQITKSLFDVPIVLVSLIDKNRQWYELPATYRGGGVLLGFVKEATLLVLVQNGFAATIQESQL